jgi:D-alanyl-lipoteichoic acid acyltransferase DltB (MBOAT superfamily)
MLFNSIDFAIFLPVVFVLYWFVFNKSIRVQNWLILVASYLFYGWWDWRFLFLVLFSTVVDYFIAIWIKQSESSKQRKLLLFISMAVNLGFLGFFKYYNFFLDNFIMAFSFFGVPFSATSLKIILPVGISFYTFQTMSYTIDVYQRKLEASKDFISFASFVSFFPQLVAGPIERATNLLPQFYTERKFNYSHATEGMRQILWGLFKKIVIADNSAEFANLIFNNSESYNGSTLVIGALFFTFQIYGDFSGYSDIAIGTSKLFGFSLMRNFAFPYFSRDIAEFWRRWHISLSTWFRDYLYIPLGGSIGGTWMKVRNTFIIFIVSGFWHGANWTFIVWGFLNACYFLPLLLTNNNRANLDIVAKGKVLPSITDFSKIILTFCLTVIAWIFFRSDNLGHAFSILFEIFSKSIFELPKFGGKTDAAIISMVIVFFLLIEWMGREKQFPISGLDKKLGKIPAAIFYIFIGTMIFLFSGQEQAFIYFQF